MKIGLNANTFAESDNLESILNLTNEFGIKNIEFWATNLEDTAESVSRYAFKGKDVKKAKEMLKKAGINVCCLTYGAGLDASFVKEKKLFSEEFVRAVEIAYDLGATVINHYADEMRKYEEINLSYYEEYWGAAIKRAEELGIVLALENEAHDMIKTPENMLKLIKGFNSKSFKTNFDATNYYQASCEPFPYSYEILKDHIAYVHIKNGCKYNPLYCIDSEWIGGAMSRDYAESRIYYLEAKSGAVNIDGLVHRLKADGYAGYCTLEPHTTRQKAIDCIKSEVAYLRAKGIFTE